MDPISSCPHALVCTNIHRASICHFVGASTRCSDAPRRLVIFPTGTPGQYFRVRYPSYSAFLVMNLRRFDPHAIKPAPICCSVLLKNHSLNVETYESSSCIARCTQRYRAQRERRNATFLMNTRVFASAHL